MVHILNGRTGIILKTGKPTILNCMDNFCPKNLAQSIHNSDAISKRIEQSAKIRKQLDADIFERDKRILQSINAKSKI